MTLDDIQPNEIACRDELLEMGFMEKEKGLTLFKVIGYTEHRFVRLDRDLYYYEGQFPTHIKLKREEEDDGDIVTYYD